MSVLSQFKPEPHMGIIKGLQRLFIGLYAGIRKVERGRNAGTLSCDGDPNIRPSKKGGLSITSLHYPNSSDFSLQSLSTLGYTS